MSHWSGASGSTPFDASAGRCPSGPCRFAPFLGPRRSRSISTENFGEGLGAAPIDLFRATPSIAAEEAASAEEVGIGRDDRRDADSLVRAKDLAAGRVIAAVAAAGRHSPRRGRRSAAALPSSIAGVAAASVAPEQAIANRPRKSNLFMIFLSPSEPAGAGLGR